MNGFIKAMREIVDTISKAEYDPKWDAEKRAEYSGYIWGLEKALDIINIIVDEEIEEMAKEFGER